jgi:hypothetical protein
MSSRERGEAPLDPVIEAYKKDIDVTLLTENLKLSHQQRLEKLIAFMELIRDREQSRKPDDTR